MFRLTRFGTIDLEYYNQVDGVGSGVTPTAYQSLPDGGALDGFGSQQKHPGVVEYSKKMRVRAPSQSALTDLYMEILSARGKRDALYRETGKGDTHWKFARLVEVVAERDFQLTKFRSLQDLELRFVTPEVFWRGTSVGLFFDAGLYFDDGHDFDSGLSQNLTSSPTTFDITVGAASDPGRAPIKSIYITIEPGASAMSNIKVSRLNGELLNFGGTVAVGSALVINTGALQVTNGGVDAYDDLVLSPSADLGAWFSLAPGVNPITVTFTGGGTGAKIHFDYFEMWF